MENHWKHIFSIQFWLHWDCRRCWNRPLCITSEKKKPTGRRFAQLLVVLYMLGFLGVIKIENMQLEGFFFYLLSGYFSGSVIHYLVAKIFGPVLFGRGFCGWACWTAMALDYLPYKRNKTGRLTENWELLRYIHFGFSLLLVLVFWFLYQYRPIPMSKSELAWLVGGNTFYFASAFILAFTLKDNRAFCKYLCPITVILKFTSRFAFLKIEGNKENCTQCGACNTACPMDITSWSTSIMVRGYFPPNAFSV